MYLFYIFIQYRFTRGYLNGSARTDEIFLLSFTSLVIFHFSGLLFIYGMHAGDSFIFPGLPITGKKKSDTRTEAPGREKIL
jgi:hypothetical protein